MTLSELQVSIVGLGLMGGSLALALRPHVAGLIGVDRNDDVLTYALEQRIVSRATKDLNSGIQGADLIVLATPVRTILRQLKELSKLPTDGCLLLDLGSTKKEIVEAMADLPSGIGAIGGHPLCGREIAGIRAADGELFAGKVFVLCRSRRTTPQAERIARELVNAVGSKPIFLPAAEHDALVAASSHLPYVAAAALLRVAAGGAASDSRLWQMCASGFASTTRLAGSDTSMMVDILLTNRSHVSDRIRSLESELATLRAFLESGDERGLREWADSARVSYYRKSD